MKHGIVPFCCIVFALLAQTVVFATQTDIHGLHAVPAPGPVKIDGDLSDWDLTGQALMCYDIENERNIYSAKAAFMYDHDNLYIAMHWKDPKPMQNHHDPHYQAGKGWAADCLQLRIFTDQVVHVTAWYYADKKEPTIQLTYGTATDPFKGPEKQLFQVSGCHLTHGADMAFKMDGDGKGYVQEMKMPWNLLAASKKYAPGDKLNIGIELLWGSTDWPDQRYADNLTLGASSREFFFMNVPSWGPLVLEPHGHINLPVPDYITKALNPLKAAEPPVAISYVLPKDALVTLAINDSNGVRVRNLIPAQPRKKGRNTEFWDGTNDAGVAVPPGKYTTAILYHDPIHMNYVMTFATPGNPGWGTADGTGGFYGDHSPPHAVAAFGNYVGLACPWGEAGQPLIGCDLNGQRLWGQAGRVPGKFGIQSLATDGKLLWTAADADVPTIYRSEIATGRFAPWNKQTIDPQGNKYAVLDLQVPGADSVAGEQFGDQTSPNMTAIAYKDRVLAVCLSHQNKVSLLDSDTGDLRKEYSVPRPMGAAWTRDGALIVISGDSLVRITPDGLMSPFSATSLPAAYAVATDATDKVYVSVRGSDQNVKVFSPAGLLLREIGKRGGRPENGVYDASGMRNPSQIAVDSLGRLWVTEYTSNPKRTSIWDVATGTLIKELVGCTSYAGAGSINPFDPTMAFSDNTVYKIDLGSGKWNPVYSLSRRDDPSDIFPPTANSHIRVIQHGGDTLVFTANRTTQVRCLIQQKGEWRSASCVGVVGTQNDGEMGVDYTVPPFTGHAGNMFTWSDKNGDGLVQEDELTFAKPDATGHAFAPNTCYWGTLPDSDGTISYIAGQGLAKFAITGYTNCGAPIYDVIHPKLVPIDQNILFGGEGHIMGGDHGLVFINQDPLITVSDSGQILGTYPSHFVSVHGSHNARAAYPGYLIGPNTIDGSIDLGSKCGGQIFEMNGNLGEHFLFTEDDIYIQTLFKDGRAPNLVPDHAIRGMSVDDTTAGGESFGSNFIKAPDGQVYLTIGGTDAQVLRVTGIDSLRRLTGSFIYSPAQYQMALRFVQQQAAASAAPHIYYIAKAAHPVEMDGKTSNWPELFDDSSDAAVDIEDSPNLRYARVSMRYDAANLYLGYCVFSHAPAPRNAGQDTHLLFKTGDAVDIMLGSVGDRTTLSPLRVLMTVANGAPIAVLNQKTAPGAAASERYKFAVIWHSITFDRVISEPQVKIVTSPSHNGYFLEAAIPWSVVGITPKSGLNLRGDVGALFADSTGATTVSRQYWSNKATGLVNDTPGEADLTPALWGTFILK